ncbi:MAG: sigma-70 family RNA polymerase sigma factor [Blastocatellia bacterium]|nr:sigma-70 family RNA polymerase sigma factor [Blastocatellia bacterium]
MKATASHLRPVPDPPSEIEILFRTHYNLVFRTAYKITGNAVDAEDVLQTVFLRLARRKEELNLTPNPEGYFYRAAVNSALDVVRSKSRSVSIEEVDETATIDPEAERREREFKRLLRKAVSSLGQKAAEMFLLKYFEGYENHEIAKLLGTSQMVVAVVLHRARSKVKKIMGTMLENYNEN